MARRADAGAVRVALRVATMSVEAGVVAVGATAVATAVGRVTVAETALAAVAAFFAPLRAERTGVDTAAGALWA